MTQAYKNLIIAIAMGVKALLYRQGLHNNADNLDRYIREAAIGVDYTNTKPDK